jgi:hypothetical protein
MVLLTGWLVVIAAVTLTPTGGASRTLSLCFGCGESGGSGLLLNVLLFVPLGALLVRIGSSVWRAALLGFALSAAIEVTQWLAIAGRTTSLSDLLANATGALVGALLWRERAALFAPHTAMAQRRLLATYAACVAGLLWFGSWSSQPWLPDGEWFLQRTPLRAWSDPHSGALRAVRVDSTDLPSDRIRDASLVQRLRSGAAPLEVLEQAGPPTRRLAYTVRLVHAQERRELLALARDGDALVLHRLTNAARLQLSAPGVRIANVYADLGGREVLWHLHPASGQAGLRSESGTLDFLMPPPSVFRAWSALLPRAFDVTPGQLRALDVLWGLMLATPLLVWLRTRWRNRSAATV